MSKVQMRMLLKHLEEFIQNWQQVSRGRLRLVTGILITKKPIQRALFQLHKPLGADKAGVPRRKSKLCS
jgi:hypothetical protein